MSWTCARHSHHRHEMFINYRASTEKELAILLDDALSARCSIKTSAGNRPPRVFLDQKCSKCAKNWRHSFVNGISHCKIIILLISPGGLEGIKTANVHEDNVLLEYELALDLEKRGAAFILPLFVEGTGGASFPKADDFPDENHCCDDSTTRDTIRTTMRKLLQFKGRPISIDQLLEVIQEIQILLDELPSDEELPRVDPPRNWLDGLFVRFLSSVFGDEYVTRLFISFHHSSLVLSTPQGNDSGSTPHHSFPHPDDVIRQFPELKEAAKLRIKQLFYDYQDIPTREFDCPPSRDFYERHEFRSMAVGIKDSLGPLYSDIEKYYLGEEVFNKVTACFKNAVTDFRPSEGWFLHVMDRNGSARLTPYFMWDDKNERRRKLMDEHGNAFSEGMLNHFPEYSFTWLTFSASSVINHGWFYNSSTTTVKWTLRRKEFNSIQALLMWYSDVSQRLGQNTYS
jgi:hypothetical protein